MEDVIYILLALLILISILLFKVRWLFNRKIYCDTNIWYDIGEGKINPQSLKGLYLVATYNNLLELTHTIKLGNKTDLQKVQRAVRALLKYSKKIDFRPSVEILIKLNVPSFSSDKKFGKQMLRSAQIFAKTDGNNISESIINDMRALARDSREQPEKEMEKINSILNINIRNRTTSRHRYPQLPLNIYYLTYFKKIKQYSSLWSFVL